MLNKVSNWKTKIIITLNESSYRIGNRNNLEQESQWGDNHISTLPPVISVVIWEK